MLKPSAPHGKPASSRPRNDQIYVAGVDIGGSNLRVALADAKGTIRGRWNGSTRRTSSPQAVVAQIRGGVDELLQQTGIARRSLRAVAAGAPGVTNRDAGIVFATSYLKGWKNVPLARLLHTELQLPAVVENDVKLAAVGERWLGAARGLRDFAFLAIGTGIAAGIFVNGELVNGPDWVAGEVGYMIVPGTPEVAAKPRTPGSLESVIGGEGIRQQWMRSLHSESSRTIDGLTATAIFERAGKRDRRALAVLERSARILAYAIYNISTVLNCELFVLGGGVGTSEALLQAMRRVLKPYTQPVRPKIVTSTLGADAQLVGAIRLALDKASG
jgi:glucokinase